MGSSPRASPSPVRQVKTRPSERTGSKTVGRTDGKVGKAIGNFFLGALAFVGIVSAGASVVTTLGGPASVPLAPPISAPSLGVNPAAPVLGNAPIPVAPQAPAPQAPPAQAPDLGNAPSSGLEGSSAGAGQGTAPNLGTGAEPAPAPSTGASGNPAQAPAHNPDPGTGTSPDTGPSPSTGTDPNVNPNPRADAGPAPQQGSSPPAQSQNSPPAQSSPPSAKKGPPEVLVFSYAPCGLPFMDTKLPASIDGVRGTGGWPLIRGPAREEMKVFWPATGEFVQIASLEDLRALREKPGWLNFFYAYSMGEGDRFWNLVSTNPQLFPVSEDALKLLWWKLNDYSHTARVAATSEQQAASASGIYGATRFQLRIITQTPVLSRSVVDFDAGFKAITGGKYPASSEIEKMSLDELIRQGYIFLVAPWRAVQFNGPSAYGLPVGFALVAPSHLELGVDFKTWSYADKVTGAVPKSAGFDFPALSPVNGKIPPHIVGVMVDEPDPYPKGRVMSPLPSGMRKPMEWTVTVKDRSGRELGKLMFDISVRVDGQ